MKKHNYFKTDLERYGGYRAFFREQSIWAVAWYRVGRRLETSHFIIQKLLSIPYYMVFRFIETFTGVSLPKEADIGKGIRIWHFGGIFVNGDSTIGDFCTIRQGVTIGNKYEGGGSPIIGDNVEFGAYSMAVGEITIGDCVQIDAYSMVNGNVDSQCVVAGIPAKVVKHNNK